MKFYINEPTVLALIIAQKQMQSCIFHRFICTLRKLRLQMCMHEKRVTMNGRNAHKNALIIQRVNILMSWHGKVITLTATLPLHKSKLTVTYKKLQSFRRAKHNRPRLIIIMIPLKTAMCKLALRNDVIHKDFVFYSEIPRLSFWQLIIKT